MSCFQEADLERDERERERERDASCIPRTDLARPKRERERERARKRENRTASCSSSESEATPRGGALLWPRPHRASGWLIDIKVLSKQTLLGRGVGSPGQGVRKSQHTMGQGVRKSQHTIYLSGCGLGISRILSIMSICRT